MFVLGVEDKIALISFLKPVIRCSSCGFRDCCNLRNAHITQPGQAWSPFAVEDQMQYLEFDFHATVSLKAISLKGGGNDTNAYVKTFRLMFSNNGIHWSTQIWYGKVKVNNCNVHILYIELYRKILQLECFPTLD